MREHEASTQVDKRKGQAMGLQEKTWDYVFSVIARKNLVALCSAEIITRRVINILDYPLDVDGSYDMCIYN